MDKNEKWSSKKSNCVRIWSYSVQEIESNQEKAIDGVGIASDGIE